MKNVFPLRSVKDVKAIMDVAGGEGGKKVVVIGGKQSIGHAIAEAVARKGADVVIWLRKRNGDLKEANVSPMTHLEIPAASANGAPQISLWRQTIARKTYW